MSGGERSCELAFGSRDPRRSSVVPRNRVDRRLPELSDPRFSRLLEESRGDVARAEAIVCPSEHAKRDRVTALSLPVHVVPKTPAAIFRRLPPDDLAERLKRLRVERPH